MYRKLNLLLIGCGKIAHDHLKCYENIKNVKIKWIYSRTPNKTKKFKNKYKSLDLEIVEDLKKFIQHNKNKIDAALVLVSPDQIFHISKLLAKNKINMFIEKPPGLNLNEIKLLTNLIQKNRLINMVGFNRRFYSNIEYLKKNEKKYGQLNGFNVECNERYWLLKKIKSNKELKDWIYCNSSHVINLLLYFCEELHKVKTFKFKGNLPFTEKFVSILKSRNNIMGSINFFSNSPGGWKIKLYYEYVTVDLYNLEQGLIINRKFKEKIIPQNREDKIYKPGFYSQAKYFVSLIRNKEKMTKSKNDLKSSISTFQLIDEITR